MTKRKLKLAFIENDSSRKATFRKRRTGFMKKMYEINKLCDVPTCAIMYSPDQPQPDVWPDPSEVRRLIELFKNVPEKERNKKMVTHGMFLKQRIEKEQEKLNKLKKENREKELRMAMSQCLAGKPLNGLDFTNLQEMGRKENELAKINQPLVGQPPAHATSADENTQDAIQLAPWSVGAVRSSKFGEVDDQIMPLGDY
ncbi:agamous-like MADS-box protein AGL80 [Pyrus ussuriensis x Pyrus communis]|uniref:Agamous-like MADS-box protein AGL80 n=1 Tax=Pyrus ussuriensis x Pyrus communis TaxID=2448454 RepID=A0A5N5HVT9_9ROSA|nr:agamous-like MADS-box protein AGL80 [Pyrus ussuriensis x Pyrus communis]